MNAFVFKNYKGVIVSEKGLNSGIHLMAYFHQVKVLYSRTLKKNTTIPFSDTFYGFLHSSAQIDHFLLL